MKLYFNRLMCETKQFKVIQIREFFIIMRLFCAIFESLTFKFIVFSAIFLASLNRDIVELIKTESTGQGFYIILKKKKTLLLLVLGVGRSIGAPMHHDIHLGDIQIDTPVYERRYMMLHFS